MMNDACGQSAVPAGVVVVWHCRSPGVFYLQHGAWRVGCGRVVGHLLHLIPGTVGILPKNHMVIARARGQGNKTIT